MNIFIRMHKTFQNILFVLAVFSFFAGRAQTVNFLGGPEEDIARSITWYNNHFYIVGTTRKDFKSSTDYYVLELYPNGSLKNQFVFGYPHYDTGFDILADETGIFVLGQSWDGGYGNNDMFLHQLSFQGDLKWTKFYGGNNNEIGHKFIKTRDGGFALAGHNRSADDLGDAYLVKTNHDGEIIWENNFGGRWVDHGFDVVENDNRELIMAGTLGGFFVANCCDFQNTDADVFIVKTNSAGEEIWEKTYGGAAHDWAKSIIEAPGGGYLVCGSTQSEGAGSFDMFLMKIDDDGNQLWFKTFGGSDFEYGEAIGLSPDNFLYILGTSASFSDNSKPDHYLVKTNLDGEEIWEHTFGGEESDYSSALVCTPDSGCVFTGTTAKGSLGGNDIVFYRISKTGQALVVSAIPPVNDSIEQISVYPNPASNRFTIYIDTKIQNQFELKLYNTTGQLLYQNRVEPNTKSIHYPQLPPGVYVYSVQQKNKVVFNGKLVFTR